MILRNGLIKQWGKKYANNTRVNFTIAFPNNCVYFNFIAARGGSTSDGWHYYNSLSNSGCNVLSREEEGMWVATGF